MKKIICLFLAVLLCFTLIGCKPKEPAVPDTTDPDTGTAITPDAAEVVYDTEKIIVDNEYAIFTIKSIEKDNFFECYNLKVYVENKTSESVLVGWEDVAVNDYMIDPFWGVAINPNSKYNGEIDFTFEEFADNGIENIEKIDFRFYMVDAEAWENQYEDTFSVIFD